MSSVLKVSEKFAEKVFSVFENSFSAHVLFFFKRGGLNPNTPSGRTLFFQAFLVVFLHGAEDAFHQFLLFSGVVFQLPQVDSPYPVIEAQIAVEALFKLM